MNVNTMNLLNWLTSSHMLLLEKPWEWWRENKSKVQTLVGYSVVLHRHAIESIHPGVSSRRWLSCLNRSSLSYFMPMNDAYPLVFSWLVLAAHIPVPFHFAHGFHMLLSERSLTKEGDGSPDHYASFFCDWSSGCRSIHPRIPSCLFMIHARDPLSRSLFTLLIGF